MVVIDEHLSQDRITWLCKHACGSRPEKMVVLI